MHENDLPVKEFSTARVNELMNLSVQMGINKGK